FWRASSARRRASYWSSMRVRSACMSRKRPARNSAPAAKLVAPLLLGFGRLAVHRLGLDRLALDGGFLLRLLPGRELRLRVVLGDAVRLLDLPGEHVALAGDDVEAAVGELAPLLLGRALELLPVAFDAIPVHMLPLSESEVCAPACARSACWDAYGGVAHRY